LLNWHIFSGKSKCNSRPEFDCTEFIFFFVVTLQVRSTFTTNAGFRGFFVQARSVADGNNVGGFLNPQPGDLYRLSSCNPSTVS